MTTQQQVVQKKRLMSDSEDEEDCQKRVILSEKDKKFGKMAEILVKIQKRIKTFDIPNILKDLDEMNKLHAKSTAIIAKEG